DSSNLRDRWCVSRRGDTRRGTRMARIEHLALDLTREADCTLQLDLGDACSTPPDEATSCAIFQLELRPIFRCILPRRDNTSSLARDRAAYLLFPRRPH